MSGELVFKEEVMRKFMEQDKLLQRMYKDLTKHSTEVESLEILFNGEVLEDVFMEKEYKRIENSIK